MANPTFYSDGYTPRRTDAFLPIIKKQVGAAIAAFGDTTPSSAPKPNDTRRETRQKLLKVTGQ